MRTEDIGSSPTNPTTKKPPRLRGGFFVVQWLEPMTGTIVEGAAAPGKQSSGLFSARPGRQAPGGEERQPSGLFAEGESETEAQ